jgi:exodeoxyribonuclease VII small subunit
VSDRKPEQPSLEQDLGRLDAIVRALEAEDLDLDRALALFEEGIERLRTARERLAEAGVRLKTLREAADGGVELDDLDRAGRQQTDDLLFRRAARWIPPRRECHR